MHVRLPAGAPGSVLRGPLTVGAGPGAELAVLESHGSAVASLVDQATTHRIIDDFTRGQAADLRGALKQAETRVEEARTALVKPLNDHVRAINARFKPLTDALSGAVRSIDGEILRDRREREAAAQRERLRLEEERRAIEKKAREEQEQRARDAATEAERDAAAAGMKPEDQRELAALYHQDEAAKPLPAVVQQAPPPPPARAIAGASGVALVKKVWDFEVFDIAALATMMPDALEVRRKVILDHMRGVEAQGGDVIGNARLAGVRAFKRDLVSG